MPCGSRRSKTETRSEAALSRILPSLSGAGSVPAPLIPESGLSAPATEAHVAALRALSARFGRQPGLTLLAVAAGVLQTAMTLVIAALLARTFQVTIILGHGLAAVESDWWWLLPAFILRALAGIGREEAGMRVSLAVRRRLRAALLDKLHDLGPAWLQQRQAGSLSTCLLEQVEALDGYFARYRPQQWFAVLTPLLILAAIAPLSWAAALILALTAPLIPLFMVLVGWSARQRQSEQLQALQRMGGHFLELIRGLPTLRLLDAHRRMGDEVAVVADEFRRRTMHVLRLAFLSGAVLEFFASVAIALSAVYFGMSFLGYLDFGLYGETLTLQVAMFALLLAPEFYQPLRDLGIHYHARAEALAAAQTLAEVLAAESLQPAGGRERGGTTAPALALDGVGFCHRPGEPVLRDCSLRVAAGEALAIRGASGGGKTTLLRLLLGQLRAQEGRILVDGRPFETLDLTVWRERIGWMNQHPRLLADTLAGNLRVARGDAGDDALREALRFAGLDPWFAALPDGLATRLGEGGRPLSGGQLRRLALARVFLRRADVLLLDEPTASLDAETEAWVVDRIGELRAGRTLILLTHRPAPLRLAERVLELTDGRLAAADLATGVAA